MDGDPRFAVVQAANEKTRVQGLVKALEGSTSAKIQAVEELADTLGPVLRKVDKVRDQDAANLLEDEIGCAIAEGLEEPSYGDLEKSLGIFLGEFCAFRR